MSRRITDPLKSLLLQLQNVISRLDDHQYTGSISILSEASLGQHTRHIIEFLTELQRGYGRGYVNYDLRERDKRIETDRSAAMALLKSISLHLDKDNKSLTLAVDLNAGDGDRYEVATNFERELVYNLEHIVHHMALMRIGIGVVSDLLLPENFGVAASTIRHRSHGDSEHSTLEPTAMLNCPEG